MPRWNITPIWQNKEVFIIGGGPSLQNFDWKLLIPELTIGCNDAFRLGEEICKVCIFGDSSWFYRRKEELAKYKGTVFTNHPSLINHPAPWLNTVLRKTSGLHKDFIGWNGNTGFAAINLALLFGASRIYLLGYDMKMRGERHNWHDGRIDKTGAIVYKKFLSYVPHIVRDWKRLFPDVEIFNITRDSDLDAFPKIDPDKFWSSRVEGVKEYVHNS